MQPDLLNGSNEFHGPIKFMNGSNEFHGPIKFMNGSNEFHGLQNIMDRHQDHNPRLSTMAVMANTLN